MKRLLAWGAFVAVIAGPAAIRTAPGQEPPRPCETSVDCRLAHQCLGGVCVPGCRVDGDCPPDRACDAAAAPHGACVPKPAEAAVPAVAPAPAPQPVPDRGPEAAAPGKAGGPDRGQEAAAPGTPAAALGKPAAGPGTPAAAPGTPAAADPLARLPASLKDDTAVLGSIGRLGWRNRVALLAGVDLVGKLLLLRFTPGFNLSMDVADRPFSLTVGIPLRLQLVDADRGWGVDARFRTEDWNRPGEWIQFLQDFTWGGPGHDFLFQLTQFETFTLGRGALIRRQDPNVVIDTHHVSALLSGFSDWAGGEAWLDDVAGPTVLGGRAYLAPLAFADRDTVQMRTLQIGASVAADVDAPLRNRIDALDADDDGRRWTEPLVDPDTDTPRAARTSVLGWGFDLGLRAVDTGVVQWDTWVDYSMLQSSVTTDRAAAPVWEDPPARGVRSGGFTWGNLLRVNLGDTLQHGLRLRLEYRNHDPNYLPGYFDLLYGVQRFQYGRGSRLPFDLATAGKAQRVLGRDPDGTRPNGMLFEFTYLLGTWLVASFGFEFNDRTPDNSLFVHLEVPDYRDFQFSATWHRRNASGARDLFRWLGGDGADLFVARCRYTVAGVFGVGLEGMTPFGLSATNTWENQWQVGLFIDLGWSFANRLPARKEARP